MKTRVNVFSNRYLNNFLNIALSQYELNLMDFTSINYNKNTTQINIIILNNSKEADLINFNKLSDNYLIMSNLKAINFKTKNYIKLLKTPMSLNQIKNSIKNFLQNLKIQFHDISIYNEKLTNRNDKSFCYLTKVELEILTYLIREKVSSKDFIKKNILNIKSNIETNSLESHLSRIRKKMNKVNTAVKIQTKNEKLLITI